MNEELFQQKVDDASQKIKNVIAEVHKKVVGQDELLQSLLIGLFARGHVLLEGVPGLAKTLSVSSLAKTLELGFNRVQFTPDLLPSDLIGTQIFNTKIGEFSTKFGPIFNHFILADEINRAPSKVQSALLEAMAERQVTIGEKTYHLDEPFVVLATQNPVEQSGTYKLPEAQLDRFILKTKVGYPEREDEIELYKRNTSVVSPTLEKVLTKPEIKEIIHLCEKIYVSDNIFTYVYHIIEASRNPEKYELDGIKKYISYGISPRGGLAIISASKVLALMSGRTFVIPEDIKKLASSALAHRLVLSYEAVSDEISSEDIIQKILAQVEIV